MFETGDRVSHITQKAYYGKNPFTPPDAGCVNVRALAPVF